MAGQKVKIDWNEAEWTKGMAKAMSEVKIGNEKQLRAVGILIQNEARRFCPVDTGRLRSSVNSTEVQRDKNGAFVEIGTNVVYAGPVEFGTYKMEPQPYLRPAFLVGLEKFGEIMKAKAGAK
jgi:HK97 gp10 family phage protein